MEVAAAVKVQGTHPSATITFPVALHPFEELTVYAYVAALKPAIVAVVCPPDQA